MDAKVQSSGVGGASCNSPHPKMLLIIIIIQLKFGICNLILTVIVALFMIEENANCKIVGIIAGIKHCLLTIICHATGKM